MRARTASTRELGRADEVDSSQGPSSKTRAPLLLLLPAFAAAFSSAGCTSLIGFQFGLDTAARLTNGDADNLRCEFQPNGCGPTGVLGVLIPDCPFGLACFDDFCEGHDLCYFACGSSKTACDEQFYINMRFLCSVRYDEPDPRLALCEGAAYIYWQIVVRFGETFYQQTQALGCLCARRDGTDPADAARVRESARSAQFGPSVAGVAPFDDADDDLLPDDWEIAFGCDPNDPLDALLDFDGDGLVNLQEYLFGTDPLRKGSGVFFSPAPLP